MNLDPQAAHDRDGRLGGTLIRCQFTALNQNFFHSAVLRHLGMARLGERVYAESLRGTFDVIALLKLFVGRGAILDLPAQVGTMQAMPRIAPSLAGLFAAERDAAAAFARVLEPAGDPAHDNPTLGSLGPAIRIRLRDYGVWVENLQAELEAAGETEFLRRHRCFEDGPLESLFDTVFGSGKLPAGRGQAGSLLVAFQRSAACLLPRSIVVLEQQFIHAFLYHYWHQAWLADVMIAHAIEEMRDAMRLTQALLDDGPSMSVVGETPPLRLEVGRDLNAAVDADRRLVAAAGEGLDCDGLTLQRSGRNEVAAVLIRTARRHERLTSQLATIVAALAVREPAAVRSDLWPIIVEDSPVRISAGAFEAMLARWT